MQIYNDQEGRIISCKIEYCEQKIVLCNTYGPDVDDKKFFKM